MSSNNELPDLRYIPDYDVHKIRSYCSQEQESLIDQLRNYVETDFAPLSFIEQRWLNDACLCRFLRARQWNLKHASRMIAETIEWRRTYKPWGLTVDDIDVELNNPGKLYQNGVDKYGRPIIVMKPGKDNTGVEVKDKKVAYLVVLLEVAARIAERNGREKVVLLIDFKNHSQLTGVSQMSVAKEVLSILQNHYPERLGACYMVNPPWTFRIFWGIVSPFLDEVTRNKIKILKHTEDMLELIPEDQLEVEYGGKCQFDYDYQTYRNFLSTEFAPENEEEAEAALHPKKKKHRKGHHGGKKHKHRRNPSSGAAEQIELEHNTDSEEDTAGKTPRDTDDEHGESADEGDLPSPREGADSGAAKKRRKKHKKHSKKASQDVRA